MDISKVSDRVLIAAYGLCHPSWSRSIIRTQIKKEHGRLVSILMKWYLLFNYEVSDKQVRVNRKKGEFLEMHQPESRGRKRKFDEEDLRKVKKELKKMKSSPIKVAKRLSSDPSFGKTISEVTIRRKTKLQGARKGNFCDLENLNEGTRQNTKQGECRKKHP